MSDYAIYLRKSRADLEAEQHGEGETLERHRTALRALAERRGLNVVIDSHRLDVRLNGCSAEGIYAASRNQRSCNG